MLAAGLLLGGLLGARTSPAPRRAARGAARPPPGPRSTTAIVEVADGAAEIALAGRERDWIERTDRAGAELARIQRRDALAGGLGAGLMTAIAGLTAVAVALVAIRGGRTTARSPASCSPR